MEDSKFVYFLKSLQKSLNIPIVYGTTENVQCFQPFFVVDENDINFIKGRLTRVFEKYSDVYALYMLNTNLIMIGILLKKCTDKFVFIGPLALESATEEDIDIYLTNAMLSEKTEKRLKTYLKENRRFTLESFKHLLVSVNTVFNEEIMSAEELTAIFDERVTDKITIAKKELTLDNTESEAQNTAIRNKYKQKLDYSVTNGDLEGLADLLYEFGNIWDTNGQSLRDAKVTALGSVFAVETVALSTGISPADLQETKDFYLYRIIDNNDINDIRRLSSSVLFDVTKIIKDYLAEKTDNPTIERTIKYIKSNICSKLTAEEIAKKLHVSEHYLFTKFKTETGETLTQYINREKIKKACYYLAFTDKPLIDIAYFLSFSTQSYFQTVFKKVMGVTPNEWRNNNGHIK